MASELDKIAEELQKEMWAGYSEVVIDHAQNPRNLGSIRNADGFASVTGPCGDTMEIWLKVRNGAIKQATFWTDGCGTTIAAGSMVTELAKGKTIANALRITQQDVLDALGGLPEESVHCALLAANTVKEAAKDYLTIRNEPWKRAYRKTSQL
ncbi:MAG: iron-sulfur cluster assembly scaffold protein [Chloroflexi bacterium]|nr:iron-sulfur cluster assembly scaffold protein [Chloroflexota bacterium]MBL7061363.1 iron-sulfur cluster assembly scaffold protein [Dehalococcoidia bacterium]